MPGPIFGWSQRTGGRFTWKGPQEMTSFPPQRQQNQLLKPLLHGYSCTSTSSDAQIPGEQPRSAGARLSPAALRDLGDDKGTTQGREQISSTTYSRSHGNISVCLQDSLLHLS